MSSLAIYNEGMIFTKKQLHYLEELPATVAHALPGAPNPDVPFFLNDPVVRQYEMLRGVWVDGKSVKHACRTFQCCRTDYYRLEDAFLDHGIVAIYPGLGSKRQHPKLERLVLLVKATRPLATATAILRLAESLWPMHPPTLSTIGHILHCHGYGISRDESDREYWHGIQECVEAVNGLLSKPGPLRNKRHRRAEFYIPEEGLQVRFELFRELASDPDSKVGKVVRRYGMSRPTFYKYLYRFRRYGAWGLIDWRQAGRGKDTMSMELELRVIEEKLEHPRLSLDALVARMRLRCSRTAVYGILRYWELLDKDRPSVMLRGLWDEEESEKPAPLVRTAKEAAEGGRFHVPKKVNGHFLHLLERLKSRPLAICDPGPIILAQFIDDLGVCEALHMYGPKRGNGSEMTNLVLLNVCRILSGYETIGNLQRNGDRSVAIAAGVGVFPGKTALYEGFTDLKFSHLQALRNDVAARARDLGLIRGERIAQDFHFKEFYGRSSEEEEIGKGPNSHHEICPGFRPHVVWDLDMDVLINIAFCNGSTRATKIVREFCERNLYPILGHDVIREMYLDSEYTSFPVINYFIVDQFSHTDVTMCLKRNRKIDQLMKQALADAQWEPFGDEYELTGTQFELQNLAKELHLVIKRNKSTGDVRCFGTTIKGLSNREVLLRYRMRWPVENGLKDLIHSYFIDHIFGKDPEKIEANLYCIQVARLAYENFLQSLNQRFARDSKGYKKTLSTFRYLLFGRHNCHVRFREKHLVLTYLDMGTGHLQSAITHLLENRTKRELNRVGWWGGLGLKIEFENQFARFLE